MTRANKEQLKAIEHSGGVILSAGAGSGKTFVLVEHIIYLTNLYIQDYKVVKFTQDFSTYIRYQYSQVAMMTFTKLAAGEIALRLEKRFIHEVKAREEEKDPDLQYWQEASVEVKALFVTTIHGFCSRLIAQGYVPSVSNRVEIINEVKFNQFILENFDDWIQAKTLRNINSELYLQLYKNKDEMVTTLSNIFNSVSLRYMWSEIQNKNGTNYFDDEHIFKTLFDEQGFNQIYQFISFNDELKKYEDKDWFQFLNKVKRDFPMAILSNNHARLFLNFFKENQFKMPMKPRSKDLSHDLLTSYSMIKELNDFFKKYDEDLEYYFNQRESLNLWINEVLDLISYIEKNYWKKDGLTYSDLEYYVHHSITNKTISPAVFESYKYLIVDEFQDTSPIQFEIILGIIRHDYKNLFVVGDIKQAIYGFRGGELGVFKSGLQHFPVSLELKSNYRSSKKIVDFNNKFFNYILNSGIGYTDRDKHEIPYSFQVYPGDENENQGEVVAYRLNLTEMPKLVTHYSDEKKLSNFDLEYLEMLGIKAAIQAIQKRSQDDIVVLYRRMKPSLLLIQELIYANISFTAQVKVPYGEDPVVAMLYLMLQWKIDTNAKSNEFLSQILNQLLKIWGDYKTVSIEDVVHFFDEIPYWGIYPSYIKFLTNQGIHCSNYSNNISVLKSLIEISHEDIEALYTNLDLLEEEKYNHHFQFGSNPDQIKIMSAHASKGLQFSHVVIGGIYTNDSPIPNRELLGEIPFSLKCPIAVTSKIKIKTPQYILEQIINKQKNFSESKRLLYVCATRAVKSLNIIHIDFDDIKPMRAMASAWYRAFLANMEIFDKDMLFQDISTEVDVDFALNRLGHLKNKFPLFHSDSLGGAFCQKKYESSILPELSVTKFSSASVCSRLFYLENICKLVDEDLKNLKCIGDSNDFIYDKNEDDLSDPMLNSNSDRGSLIHKEIELYIKENKQIRSLDYLAINWLTGLIDQKSKNYNLVSEKNFKFSIWGHMVSGTPDLICYPEDKTQLIEIWDFKTGKNHGDKILSYWSQLLCYAYAIFQRLSVSNIKLSILWIDQQKVEEKTFNVDETNQHIRELFLKTQTPWIENTSHCNSCLYKQICRT